MKFYDLALMLFIVNLMIGFVNMLGIFGTSYTQVAGLGAQEIKQSIGNMTASVSQSENTIWPISQINWFAQNIYLIIQGMAAFLEMFLNATIFSKGMYTSLLCTGTGIDCTTGAANYFINMLYLATLFIYAAGLFQLITGRSTKELD